MNRSTSNLNLARSVGLQPADPEPNLGLARRPVRPDGTLIAVAVLGFVVGVTLCLLVISFL